MGRRSGMFGNIMTQPDTLNVNRDFNELAQEDIMGEVCTVTG